MTDEERKALVEGAVFIRNGKIIPSDAVFHNDPRDAEIERLRAALKRIAGGWPKPMQLARETLEQKK